MSNRNPFSPAELVRKATEHFQRSSIDVVTSHLDENGYSDVLVLEQFIVPGTFVFVATQPHRADEALYMVEKRGLRPAGVTFVELDDFCRVLLEQQYAELRDLRINDPLLGLFWLMVYFYFPNFARTP